MASASLQLPLSFVLSPELIPWGFFYINSVNVETGNKYFFPCQVKINVVLLTKHLWLCL
jgi:hypothetical protein